MEESITSVAGEPAAVAEKRPVSSHASQLDLKELALPLRNRGHDGFVIASCNLLSSLPELLLRCVEANVSSETTRQFLRICDRTVHDVSDLRKSLGGKFAGWTSEVAPLILNELVSQLPDNAQVSQQAKKWLRSRFFSSY
jgi:hypothetical protein